MGKLTKAFKALMLSNATALVPEVQIFGEIGGDVSAIEFTNQLRQLRGAPRLDIRINSGGGGVFDGFAIANAIAAFPGETVAFVDGLAASMASVIAVSADRTVIAENGFMMIHNPFGLEIGDSDAMRNKADMLDQITDQLIRTYENKTGESPGQISDWMNAETWFNAQSAIEHGFADEIGLSIDVAAKIDIRRFSNMPEDAKSFIKPEEGESFLAALNREIANLETPERARKEIVSALAVGAKLTDPEVWKILSGESAFPTSETVDFFDVVLTDMSKAAATGDTNAGSGDNAGNNAGDPPDVPGSAGGDKPPEIQMSDKAKGDSDAAYQEGIDVGKLAKIGDVKAEYEARIKEIAGETTAVKNSLNEQIVALTEQNRELVGKVGALRDKVKKFTGGLDFNTADAGGDADTDPPPVIDAPDNWQDAMAQAQGGDNAMSYEKAMLYCMKTYPALHKDFVKFSSKDAEHRAGVPV